MTQPIDPRAAQALHLLSRLRGLLDQHERVLRIPDVHQQCNIDLPLRSMKQALHALAQSWNGALANVPEPPPEMPPAPPVITPTPTATEWSTSAQPLAQRMLAD
jgi:hypothetical protein